MDNLANLIRAVVLPECLWRPVYLIRAEQAPLDLYGRPDWLAWTGHNLDLIYRQHLEQQGEWKGRGPAIAFSESYYLLNHDEQMGVVAHECGHWASWPGTERDAEVSSFESDRIRKAHAQLYGMQRRIGGWELPYPSRPRRDAFCRSGDADHGPAFCRLAYHAAFRLARMGEQPDPLWLLGHTALSFSEVEAACAIEAADMFTLPLSSVGQSPLPDGLEWRIGV